MYYWGSIEPIFPVYSPSISEFNPSLSLQNQNFALEEKKVLLDKIEQLQKENQHLKSEVNALKNKKSLKSGRKIKRRTQGELRKNLRCLFPHCKKEYASSLALNLHMKIKHNAGTKRDREQLAFQIIEAEQKGEKMPEVSIDFPPNFIENLKKKKRFFSKSQNSFSPQQNS